MRRGLLMVVVAACLSLSAACADDDPRPSEDCARAESALRHWAGAMAVVLPDPNSAAAMTKAAQAGTSIRLEAQDIESGELRTKLDEVADAFTRMGSSNQTPQGPAFPDAPSKDYFAARTQMDAALHDIKQLCPTIGDGAPATAG